MDDDEQAPCPWCGDTETVELCWENDRNEGSVTICATCGSDA